MPFLPLPNLVQRWLLAIDRDALWLGLFRHDAQQIDAEQTVGQARGLHFDVVSQAERQLEGPLGNALVQIGDAFGAVVALATDNGQDAFSTCRSRSCSPKPAAATTMR